jgi:hypoxanthine phosphoribosyltransferase
METNSIKVLDKEFEIYLNHDQIVEKINETAKIISKDLKNENPLFLGILNGSFMFISDLFKELDLDCNISFLKLASYSGTNSTGTVKRLIGLNEDIKDRTVVIIEDIVDTGITLDHIIKQLKGYEPAKIKICTLLFKPNAYKMSYKVDYCAFKIPNDFIVGYGLDYDGYGRNYKNIYKIIQK